MKLSRPEAENSSLHRGQMPGAAALETFPPRYRRLPVLMPLAVAEAAADAARGGVETLQLMKQAQPLLCLDWHTAGSAAFVISDRR